MRPLPLSRSANWTGGRVHGADATVDAVSIDTRALAPGDCEASEGRATLFVALKGERFDGHDHAAAALAAGARALLVARVQPLDVSQLVVADTERALGDFAGA
jgi:UDP-N-acetylmuramoyl-tripeptide--D-alanyl-D-alanine ligase